MNTSAYDLAQRKDREGAAGALTFGEERAITSVKSTSLKKKRGGAGKLQSMLEPDQSNWRSSRRDVREQEEGAFSINRLSLNLEKRKQQRGKPPGRYKVSRPKGRTVIFSKRGKKEKITASRPFLTMEGKEDLRGTNN